MPVSLYPVKPDDPSEPSVPGPSIPSIRVGAPCNTAPALVLSELDADDEPIRDDVEAAEATQATPAGSRRSLRRVPTWPRKVEPRWLKEKASQATRRLRQLTQRANLDNVRLPRAAQPLLLRSAVLSAKWQADVGADLSAREEAVWLIQQGLAKATTPAECRIAADVAAARAAAALASEHSGEIAAVQPDGAAAEGRAAEVERTLRALAALCGGPAQVSASAAVNSCEAARTLCDRCLDVVSVGASASRGDAVDSLLVGGYT